VIGAWTGGDDGNIPMGDSIESSIMLVVLRDCIIPPGGGGNNGAGDEVVAPAGPDDILTLVAPSLATEGLML